MIKKKKLLQTSFENQLNELVLKANAANQIDQTAKNDINI